MAATVVVSAAELSCRVCGKKPTKRCGSCSAVRYCSPACQKADWPRHKPECSKYTHAPNEALIAVRVKSEKLLDREERLVAGFSPDEARDYFGSGKYTSKVRRPRNQADVECYLEKQIAEEERPSSVAFERWARSHILRTWPSVRQIERDAKAAPANEVFLRYLRSKLPSNVVPHVEMWLHVSFFRLDEVEEEQADSTAQVLFMKTRMLPERELGRKMTLLPLQDRDIIADWREQRRSVGVIPLPFYYDMLAQEVDWKKGKPL